MTSGKKARKQRQTVARPPVRSTGGRRASPKVLAIVAGAIAVAAVIAVGAIALVGHSSSSSSSQTTTGALTTLPGASDVLAMFKGIPQHGNVLGSPKAPVTMVQYIDLQCPICRAFETEVMPTIVSRDVRNGKVKVVYRPIAFIGADSERGRRAALSVGLQNRLAQFSQLLYANQGTENSGWLTDDLVRAAYASIPGVNVQEAMNNRTSHKVLSQEQTFDTQATQDQVSGTPTVLIGKTGGKLVDVSPGTAPSISDLQNAIDALEQQK